MLEHQHYLVNAKIVYKPINEFQLNEWLTRLVEIVGMKIFIPPVSKECFQVGNEGITGVVVIETSHASIHIWSNPGQVYGCLRFDLYSCKKFDPALVDKHIQDYFNTVNDEYHKMNICRNDNFQISL